MNKNFPKIQMPGGCPGGMLKLRFDWNITENYGCVGMCTLTIACVFMFCSPSYSTLEIILEPLFASCSVNIGENSPMFILPSANNCEIMDYSTSLFLYGPFVTDKSYRPKVDCVHVANGK